MKKNLWLLGAIFWFFSCSAKSEITPSQENPLKLNLMTYLMNLQSYGPIIRTTMSSDGRTSLVERLDNEHRVIREDLYFDGQIITTAQYNYDENDQIIQSLTYDNEGKLISHQQFMYHTNNSLWQIFQDNRVSLYQQNYVYTSDKQKDSLMVDYYRQGLLTSTFTYHAQILAKEKNYFYQQGYLVKKTFKDMQDMSERIEYYNQDQILTALTFLRNNEFVEHEEYFYQDKKLISKTIEDEEGQITKYEYQYDENGTLTKSDLYQDNTLRQSTTYLPDGKYIIEYYAFGQVRMSELYENNVLVEQNINDVIMSSEEDFLD